MGKGKRIQNKKNIIIGIIFLIIIAGILGYIYLIYSQKEPPKKKKPKNTVEEKKLTIVDEDSNARPIAVMIDNNIGNGRHAGLQDSYINYEIIVEGGLTRIMAVFKDKDVDLIGPVRSSRHYFLDYALESDAIYAHYGWSTYAQNDIKALKDLCKSIDKKDVETFLDASIKKAGKDKGKFDSATLEKYIEIYRKNRYLNPMGDIEYMAKCLALEEDDYALDTFAKLYNLRWKTGSRFGSEELLDRRTLHFILMMCCLENQGAPQRPCYKPVLDNLNKLMTMKLPMS